jgi:hypothetical protein
MVVIRIPESSVESVHKASKQKGKEHNYLPELVKGVVLGYDNPLQVILYPSLLDEL